jgi:hypothetical protein
MCRLAIAMPAKRTGSRLRFIGTCGNRKHRQLFWENDDVCPRGREWQKGPLRILPNMRTTVRWHLEGKSHGYIFAANAFDDIPELKAVGEMYTGVALPWARLGCELERPGLSDDGLKKAMIERTRLLLVPENRRKYPCET